MNILIACEFSGIVRDVFIERGHDAVSCDLLESERLGPHITGDVLYWLDDGWDMMIAHPPCTYLAISGNRWMKPKYRDRFPTRQQDRQDAIEFFMQLVRAPIEKIAIENPIGVISSVWKPPDQYVQPYYFGDPQRKKTGLWLKNLPKLKPTDQVEPIVQRLGDGKNYPEWLIKSSKCATKSSEKVIKSPGERANRAKERSRTYPGLAKAMAEQWG